MNSIYLYEGTGEVAKVLLFCLLLCVSLLPRLIFVFKNIFQVEEIVLNILKKSLPRGPEIE